MMDAQTLQVQTEAHGAVPALAAEVAARKVRSLLRLAPEPVLFARVKLTMAADPAVKRPAIAQVNLDLNGRLIRAQATGADMREAVNRMSDRLRIRLDRAARNWAATRGGKPVLLPHEWRHQSLPRRACPTSPAHQRNARSSGTRRTRWPGSPPRRPSPNWNCSTTTSTCSPSAPPARTASSTGPAIGYRLAQARPRPGGLGPVHAAVTVSEHPAPRLTLAAATARLEALGQPFLFFVNSETRRGNLIYHRYDGNYGVITPPGS